jgi:ubiquitin-conjugating enzyme E2 Q
MRWLLRCSICPQPLQDLAQLASATGAPASLLLELSFPPDFPTSPFSVRVVTPRCKMYTGHVTVGGSVCLQALVATGQPGGWEPTW